MSELAVSLNPEATPLKAPELTLVEPAQTFERALIIEVPSDENVEPRYDLSKEELDILQAEMVNLVKQNYPADELAGLWVSPYHKFANFVRTNEASYFPEVQELSDVDESQTLFFALIDTRNGGDKVIHAATACGLTTALGASAEHEAVEDVTGFITIDDLIDLKNFTTKEFYDYYSEKGIDLDKCISIETNFRVGEKVEKFNGLGSADIAYLMFFKLLQSKGAQLDRAAVFATINRVSIISFQRAGLAYEPIMGQNNLETPESHLGVVSLPVFIPYNEHSRNLFAAMGQVVPSLFI